MVGVCMISPLTVTTEHCPFAVLNNRLFFIYLLSVPSVAYAKKQSLDTDSTVSTLQQPVKDRKISSSATPCMYSTVSYKHGDSGPDGAETYPIKSMTLRGGGGPGAIALKACREPVCLSPFALP